MRNILGEIFSTYELLYNDESDNFNVILYKFMAKIVLKFHNLFL